MLEMFVGPAFLLLATLFGIAVLTVFEPRKYFYAPALGIAMFACATSILLMFNYTQLTPLLLLMMACFVAYRFRQVMAVADAHTIQLSAIILALIATSSILFMTAPFRDDTFWTIYHITRITPGDSPQSLMQAQYLLYGSKGLSEGPGLRDFALFDRPFGGAVITAGVLCGFGLCPGRTFYSVSLQVAQAYTSLWISLNALSVVSIWMILSFVTRRAAAPLTMLLAFSPFIVFNTLGLWPKLFGLYWFVLSAYLALRQRYLLFIIFGSVAFFVHGSFLWPFIALAGYCALQHLTEGFHRLPSWNIRRWRMSILIITSALIVPAIWFGTEAATGESSPLRMYYLYNASPSDGLHRAHADIIREFYASTTIYRLMLLPLINFVRFILPTDLLAAIFAFNLSAQNPDFASAAYWTEMNRPFFFAGFVLGGVSFWGLIRYWRTEVAISLSILICLIAPVMFGAAFYRKNDHIITLIQFSAIVPIAICLAHSFEALQSRNAILLFVLACVEYVLLYTTRLPKLGLLAVTIAMAAILAIGIHHLRISTEPRNASPRPALSPPIGVVTFAVILCVFVLPLLPVLVLVVLGDGGFETLRHGVGR